jgi:pyrroloquinoline quinone biosynthesis protein B
MQIPAMQIRLLGTAAGGGVPQWNCNCQVCREARVPNGRVHPRTQSSVAISADGQRWFLLNASPDLRSQIESNEELQPPRTITRGSPIDSVLLTNADLDHTAGLLFLREGEKLTVHAPANVQAALVESLAFGPTLERFCGVRWIEPPATIGPLLHRDGSPSGLSYQALALRGESPRFYRKTSGPSEGNVIAYYVVDTLTGGRLIYAPQVGSFEKDLLRLLPECDVLLFDGTFWSENELAEAGAGTLPASAMGHVPIGGDGGSLKVLAGLNVKHKIYTHINNTNPILLRDSPEQTTLIAAGCAVGADGMQLLI